MLVLPTVFHLLGHSNSLWGIIQYSAFKISQHSPTGPEKSCQTLITFYSKYYENSRCYILSHPFPTLSCILLFSSELYIFPKSLVSEILSLVTCQPADWLSDPGLGVQWPHGVIHSGGVWESMFKVISSLTPISKGNRPRTSAGTCISEGRVLHHSEAQGGELRMHFRSGK